VRRLEEQKRQEIVQVWERYRSNSNLHSDSRYQQSNRRW
jgi:hypothetical protein